VSAPSRPIVIDSIVGMREAVRAERAAGRTVSLTPTLGALHAGHFAHVERAAEIVDTAVVSIFVNPTQFTTEEDLAKYPRDLDADLDALSAFTVAYVFAPSVAEMYPTGPTETKITAGPMGLLYEGAARPGHFDGVLTVVAKLLSIVGPDVVTFGQKDAQQLFLVRRMIDELNIPTRVEIIDTVREDDGLALSSRNQFLDARQRRAARTLSIALEAAASSGDRGIDATLAAAQAVFMGEPLVMLDYFKVVQPKTFVQVDDDYRGKAIAIVAATLGSTRLLDNEQIYLN